MMEYVEPHLGMQINEWTVTKTLGSGYFGDVYLAQAAETLGAIKFMSSRPGALPGSTEFSNASRAFLDEGIKSMNFSDSAYVLTAIDVGETPWPWILYPYLDRGTVESLMTSGPLMESTWWNLAHDLLSGLDNVHSEGLVHKDIKWDNVMVVDDRFVIVDLGIAEISGFEEFSNGISNRELTPPEVLASVSSWNEVNPSEFAPSADIFAAGMMLYKCIFRSPAWPLTFDTSSAERLAMMQFGQPDLEKLPQAIADLLKKMLEVNAKKRPNARSLLFDVVPHIDIRQKVKQVEDSYFDVLERALGQDKDSEPINNETREYDLSGPFADWNGLAEELREIVEDVRPSYFVVDVERVGAEKLLYFQAMSHGSGWTLECVSQLFQTELDSRDLRVRLKHLGWNPPTASSPNYQRDEASPSTEDLIVAFISALQIAFRVSPGEISRFHIRTQDVGAY